MSKNDTETTHNVRIVINEYTLGILVAGAILGYWYSTLNGETREAIENMAYGSLWVFGVVSGMLLTAALLEITELDW